MKGREGFRLTHWDVLLVRHGESEANATGRFAVRTWDPHLTAKGHEQARQLALQLSHAPIRHVVTSPLARAMETIEPVASQHLLTPTVLGDLTEVDLGGWDGQRLRDLERHGDYRAWRQDPQKNPPPGGERICDVGQRVLGALQEFFATHNPGLTIASTHADCVKGALLVVMGAGGPAARRVFVPNTGQLLLRWTHPGKWLILLSPLVVTPPAH